VVWGSGHGDELSGTGGPGRSPLGPGRLAGRVRRAFLPLEGPGRGHLRLPC